jgi:predicted dehydrogenase
MAHLPTIGLIGANGRWGQVILATLKSLNVPTITANSKDWYIPISSKQCQGIIIATPSDTHIDLAEEALKRSIPVFIEKPLALSSNDIIKLYPYQDLTILINHIHLFSNEFQILSKIVKDKKIIKINSVGLGTRRDPWAIFDYCHDFSMSLYLTSETPKVEKIEKITTLAGEVFDITLKYKEFYHSMLIGNGAEKPKTRYLEIECDDGTHISYNGYAIEKLRVNYQPVYDIEQTPPLTNAINLFLRAITHGMQGDDRFGLDLGRKVVKVAENCYKKLEKDISQER